MATAQDTSGVQPAAAIGADLHFRRALDQGRFLIQQCAACTRAVFYPRMVCPHCGSDRLDWIEPSGAATVYSTTVVRGRPQDGGDRNVALLDLAEGVRMMARVDGVAPADVTIGMAVQAQVLMDEGAGKVVFVPAAAALAAASPASAARAAPGTTAHAPDPGMAGPGAFARAAKGKVSP